VYVDDLAIASNDWKSHLQQLDLTLRTLQEANISCNPRKIDIGASEIEYLGYRLSGDSVHMSRKRIEVINNITAPRNVKALQRLLRMFQYWRKLIPYLAKRTFNMRQLLKKNTPFKWTTDCLAELDYLNHCLVSNPRLKPLDSNRNPVISVDGSTHGIGFSILQADDHNNLHAVKYGSFATTPTKLIIQPTIWNVWR